jgi:hypothetical protein
MIDIFIFYRHNGEVYYTCFMQKMAPPQFKEGLLINQLICEIQIIITSAFGSSSRCEDEDFPLSVSTVGEMTQSNSAFPTDSGLTAALCVTKIASSIASHMCCCYLICRQTTKVCEVYSTNSFEKKNSHLLFLARLAVNC